MWIWTVGRLCVCVSASGIDNNLSRLKTLARRQLSKSSPQLEWINGIDYARMKLDAKFNRLCLISASAGSCISCYCDWSRCWSLLVVINTEVSAVYLFWSPFLFVECVFSGWEAPGVRRTSGHFTHTFSSGHGWAWSQIHLAVSQLPAPNSKFS